MPHAYKRAVLSRRLRAFTCGNGGDSVATATCTNACLYLGTNSNNTCKKESSLCPTLAFRQCTISLVCCDPAVHVFISLLRAFVFVFIYRPALQSYSTMRPGLQVSDISDNDEPEEERSVRHVKGRATRRADVAQHTGSASSSSYSDSESGDDADDTSSSDHEQGVRDSSGMLTSNQTNLFSEFHEKCRDLNCLLGNWKSFAKTVALALLQCGPVLKHCKGRRVSKGKESIGPWKCHRKSQCPSSETRYRHPNGEDTRKHSLPVPTTNVSLQTAQHSIITHLQLGVGRFEILALSL